jgi:nucleotide-binding universal stress UspA family protein
MLLAVRLYVAGFRAAHADPLCSNRCSGLWTLVGGRRGAHDPRMAQQPLVLVDVRPTDCGYRALLWALREAERRNAQLLAITVWPGDPGQPDDGRAEMEQALTAMVACAVEESGVHGRTRVAALTHPVTAADVAVRTGAELLVMGSEPVPTG